MAYSSGKIEGSHQLAHIIHAMMRDEGWEIVKGLRSDGYDSVFYSSGSDGYQDIYVRVGAGLYDHNIVGDIQMPVSDGYTGYLNFLAYQSWDATKEGTDGGNNEIGRSGPVLYVMGATSGADRELYEYNLMTSDGSTTNSRVVAYNVPIYTKGSGREVGGFDGHSKSYHIGGGTSNTDLYQIDYRRGYSNRFIWSQEWEGTTTARAYIGFAVRKLNDELLIYYISNVSSEYGYQPHIVNQDNFEDYRKRFFSPSPFSAANTVAAFLPGGFMARGPARTRDTEGIVYFGDEEDVNWFAYDVKNDNWNVINNFTQTITPTLPVAAGDGRALVLMKELSGYDKDRLYVMAGSNDDVFASIALEDDGTPTGAWTSHANLPFNASTAAGLFILGDYIGFTAGANTNGDRLYKWQIPASPTDAGSWVEVGSPFFVQNNSSEAFVEFHNNLSSRVRIRETDSNEYWAFVDEDRVLVVTKTNGTGLTKDTKYHYAYAGLFNTYHDKRVTTLTANAASSSATLDVASTSIFKIGERYAMIDVTGTRASLSDTFGNSYNMAPAVAFTVTGISRSASTITIDPVLPRDFVAGSKIGEDPQPVGVRREKTDQFYALNNLNSTNDHISRDPAWQWYHLREMHQSDPNHGDKSFDKFRAHNMTYSMKENARGKTAVSPAIIYNGDDPELSDVPGNIGFEVRGDMIGVYYCSKEFPNESVITINGQKYVIFDIYESSLAKIAVGPIEE